jgi:O-acetylserine/cysteine efflux transporter
VISPIHFALILFVVANWGLSFVVIHVGLQGVPPLLLAALRFTVATVVCFGAWAYLIGRYSAVQVAPFSLLVPVFGMGLSAWLLNESFTAIKLLAAVLVVIGLLFNSFGHLIGRLKVL